MIYKVLFLYYLHCHYLIFFYLHLLLFPLWDKFENNLLLFSLRLHGVVVFIHDKENWQPVAGPGSIFPAFCHTTFQHASMITCCHVSQAGYIA